MADTSRDAAILLFRVQAKKEANAVGFRVWGLGMGCTFCQSIRLTGSGCKETHAFHSDPTQTCLEPHSGVKARDTFQDAVCHKEIPICPCAEQI